VTYRPAGPVTAISRPVSQSRAAPTLPAHSQTVSAPRPEPWTTGLGLNPNNYPQWGNNTYKPPVNAGGDRANNVGSNVVCYKCGQPGHMHPNCPRLKGNVRATAVRREVTPPTVGDPSNESPPMEGGQEGSEDDLNDHPTIEEPAAEAADIWDDDVTPYEWDDRDGTPDNEPMLMYRSSTIQIPQKGGTMAKHSHAMRFLDQVLPPNRRKTGQLNISTVSVNKLAEPMYHHRSHQKSTARPDRPHIDNSTISGFWEINGTCSHCLLDSGSEGIKISPDFTHATGMKTFTLEQPIALQLACVGSRCTINYGTHATIRFGDRNIQEYFNIMNIEYYDVILGTPSYEGWGLAWTLMAQAE
jgi:Zinc knuckle